MSLPTIPQADVASHNTAKSCYVTIGTKVYDVTPFLADHPGGDDLILEYAGKDVSDIMTDAVSHTHTESAYEILDDYLIGYLPTASVLDAATASSHPDQIVPLPPSANGAAKLPLKDRSPLYAATGLSSAEDLSKETDFDKDYKTHKFLDLNKPLLMQVLRGGFTKEFYLEQVHRPRHYKGGDSAPLFGNFLEPLSKTAWYVVPIVWVPPVAFGTYTSAVGLGNPFVTAAYWSLGLGIWTVVEYVLHRFLFHLDAYLPDASPFLALHFLLHGIHHYLPMDRYRLVMPPTLFIILATPFWYLAHTVFAYNWYAATAVYCGGVFGYICYDLTHYFLHHKTLPAYWRGLKKYHLAHHFADYQVGYGVTSRFWDRVFGTELVLGPTKVLKTS